MQSLLGTLGTQIVDQTGKMDTVLQATANESRFGTSVPGLATDTLPPLNISPQALLGSVENAPLPNLSPVDGDGVANKEGGTSVPNRNEAAGTRRTPHHHHQQFPGQQQQQFQQGLTPPSNNLNIMSGKGMGQQRNALPMQQPKQQKQQQQQEQYVPPASAAPLKPLQPSPVSLPAAAVVPGTANTGGSGGVHPSPGIPMVSPLLRSTQVERASDWATRAKAEYFNVLTSHTNLMQNFNVEAGKEDDAREEMEFTMSNMHVMYKEMMAAKKALDAAEFADKRWTVQPPPHQAGHRIKCSAIKAEMEAGNLDVSLH